MTPKMPKEFNDFRRRQILEAAWKCFAEKGYHGTTMRYIAKSMDLSTGVIYNYFKSKDEILGGLMELAIETQEKIFETMEQKNNTKEAILELFNTCFENCPIENFKESSKANIYIWSEAIKKKKIMEMINIQFEQAQDKVAQFVKNGIKRGEIQADLDPKTVAIFYMALITGLQVQSVLIKDLDPTAYYNEIKKILFQNMWR